MIVPVYPQAFIKFLYLKTWLNSPKIRLELTDTLSLACRAGTVGSLSAGAADTAYTAWARLIGSYRTVLTWCRTSWTVLTYGKMALRGGTGERGKGTGGREQGTGGRRQGTGDRGQGLCRNGQGHDNHPPNPDRRELFCFQRHLRNWIYRRHKRGLFLFSRALKMSRHDVVYTFLL